MYSDHTTCRACGFAAGPSTSLKHSTAGAFAYNPAEKLLPVFDLGIQPMANDFCKQGEDHAGYAPLSVLFCPRCTLAQLSVVVDPETLYRRYLYQTSTSAMMQRHFVNVLSDIEHELGERLAGPVVEIGSNDGEFLHQLKELRGVTAVGIDPAKNLAELATKKGVFTIERYFNLGAVSAVRQFIELPQVVIARHCFCHTDEMAAFVRGLEALANPATVIYIEVPYVLDQIQMGSFDQIYHEHLSYLSIRSMVALLSQSTLHVHRIIRYSIHGGAIGILLRRRDCGTEPHPSVGEYLDNEKHLTAGTWTRFFEDSQKRIKDLKQKVWELVSDGKRVAGYGASAKSTVWINACGFTRKDLAFITDCTPGKQYTTSPGSGIPITDPGALLREMPDVTIVFAWNFLSEIREKEALYLQKGGQFLVPLPKLELVGA